MMKLLVVFGLIFGIFYFFYHRIKVFLRDLLTPPGAAGGEGKQPGPAGPAGRIDKGVMARCPVCGVYFPESTGVKGRAGLCCSTACAAKPAPEAEPKQENTDA